jgi:PKD repeat protein
MSGVINVLAPPIVFINEIHYDNTGSDSLEGIEIAGPAGIDLGCYELVLYNGNGNTVYNTISLSGTIPNESCGYGALWFPILQLQNGSPDGMALYDACNMAVLQFLSYEGTITAADGPALGMTSTDIVVDEPGSTPGGFSLQLQGSGTTYADFTWAGPDSNTYGQINTGQDFGPLCIITSLDTSLCEGGSAIVSASISGGTPPYTYFWNSLGNSSSHTVSPSTTTIYTVYASDSLNLISATKTITISVWPNPTTTTSADTSICEGSAINITGTASNGTPPYSYQWNNSLPDSGSHTVSPTVTTIYTVTASDAVGCASASDSIVITVNPSPVIDISSLVIDSSSCGNSDGNITGLSVSNGTVPYTYQWEDGNSTVVGTAIDLTNVPAGNYSFTVIDSNNCSASSNTFSISDAGAPIITASPDTSICEGDSTVISVTVTGGVSPYTYLWDNGLPGFSSNTVAPTVTTTYNVVVVDNVGCQSGYDSVNVKLDPIPLAGFTSAANGLNAVFTNTSTGGAIYHWDFGDGNTEADPNPSHNYSSEGNYTVCLTVTSSEGCIASLCKTITINSTGILTLNEVIESTIYPNPSNDGIINLQINHDFDLSEATITIYNTAGKILNVEDYSVTAFPYKIDLSGQPNGVYYIRVSGNKAVIIKKFTIIQ